jgi:hypothetical protein
LILKRLHSATFFYYTVANPVKSTVSAKLFAGFNASKALGT